MSFDDVNSILSEGSTPEKKDEEQIDLTKKVKSKLNEEIDLKELYTKASGGTRKFFSWRYSYELFLLPIIWLTWSIRTRNLENLSGKYLIGLDPYYYFRLARELLENGSLPAIDAMRVFPFGKELSFNLFPYFLAFWNKLLNIFGAYSLEYTSIIYTPALTAMSVVFLYLFLKNVFDKRVALLGSLILIVSPAYLFRTIAGFSDHEALFMFFMFLALWLFSEIKVRKKFYSKLSFAAGSGFTTFLAATTWSATPILTIPIGGYILMELFWSNKKKSYLTLYSVWFAAFFLPLAVARGSDGFRELGLVLPAFAIASFGAYLILEKRKVKLKVPNSLLAIGTVGIVGSVLAQLLGLINFGALWRTALTPAEGSGRVADTISEIISGTAVFNQFGWFAVLALLGASMAAYYGFENESKKPKLFLGVTTFLVGGAILFSGQSIAVNILLLLVFAISLIAAYTATKSFSKSKNHLAVILVFMFLFTAYLTNTGARFLFTFAPAVAMLSSYAVFKTAEIPPKQYRKLIGLALVLLVAALLYSDYQDTIAQAQRTGSGLPGQWEDTFNWVRENTEEGAGIAHWWDYGYWTQAIGERPSIADGGTHGEYMLYLLGRYGMTGQTREEALTYFNTHNISYVIYSREEIGKYWAFSHIGSNKELDRESTIGSFGLSDIREVRDGRLLIYRGGWGFDADVVIDGKVFAKSRAQIHTVELFDDGTGGVATFTDGSETVEDPVECLVADGQKTVYSVDSKLGGCFVLVPGFDENGNGNPSAALLYLSEKSKNSIFTRLYIQNEEIEGFEEVYSDGTPLGIFRGQIIGPVKIWKTSYTADIGTNPLWQSISKEQEEGFR